MPKYNILSEDGTFLFTIEGSDALDALKNARDSGSTNAAKAEIREEEDREAK